MLETNDYFVSKYPRSVAAILQSYFQGQVVLNTWTALESEPGSEYSRALTWLPMLIWHLHSAVQWL